MDGSRCGIDKAASLWTLCGWSPPWTLAAVTLHVLKSPLTWMYDGATYRNHAKNHRVNLMRLIPLYITPLFTLACPLSTAIL